MQLKRSKRFGNRGQSMIEYLVIAGLVIAAILLIVPNAQQGVTDTLQAGVDAIGKGKDKIATLDVQPQ